ncbi:hypothetical protein [uncultured Marivita sp.]|uniref:hypothetical protein n=1 Tax=uncultured Marivita sp. TaxID=888080 RepID=UPI00261288DF|nr:hypothetical protein [uncultured Marivita sp.]
MARAAGPEKTSDSDRHARRKVETTVRMTPSLFGLKRAKFDLAQIETFKICLLTRGHSETADKRHPDRIGIDLQRPSRISVALISFDSSACQT